MRPARLSKSFSESFDLAHGSLYSRDRASEARTWIARHYLATPRHDVPGMRLGVRARRGGHLFSDRGVSVGLIEIGCAAHWYTGGTRRKEFCVLSSAFASTRAADSTEHLSSGRPPAGAGRAEANAQAWVLRRSSSRQRTERAGKPPYAGLRGPRSAGEGVGQPGRLPNCTAIFTVSPCC
jgi:hypothetical protein